MKPDLESRHYRALRHMRSEHLVGWANFHDTEQDLETLGLIRGEWAGAIDCPPRPTWRLTSLGSRVLREREEALALEMKKEAV